MFYEICPRFIKSDKFLQLDINIKLLAKCNLCKNNHSFFIEKQEELQQKCFMEFAHVSLKAKSFHTWK
jgi:hypothetical protein